jgi:outer membrane lipoprotein-sorting protein
MRNFSLCVACVVFVSSLSFGQEGGSDGIDAKQLVRNVVKAYRDVQSYQDDGAVIETERRTTKSTTSTTTFEIAFQRPDLLKVEWTNDMPLGGQAHSLLISDGEDVYLWMEMGNTHSKLEDLRMGIASATGISQMAANTIPSLLLEAASGGSTEFSVLREPSLLGDEEFEGVPCYVLAAIDASDQSIKYWIGVNDFLIRKIERIEASTQKSRQRILKSLETIEDEKLREQIRKSIEEDQEDSSRTDQQIHRNIRLNGNIPTEEFHFIVPEGSKEQSLGARD